MRVDFPEPALPWIQKMSLEVSNHVLSLDECSWSPILSCWHSSAEVHRPGIHELKSQVCIRNPSSNNHSNVPGWLSRGLLWYLSMPSKCRLSEITPTNQTVGQKLMPSYDFVVYD